MAGTAVVSKTDVGTWMIRLIDKSRIVDRIEVDDLVFTGDEMVFSEDELINMLMNRHGGLQ
jgi:hypothetical protein